MCSENCVVWAQNPINVVSFPLPSFRLYFLFFVTSFLKKIRSAFWRFPSIFFKNSSSHVLLFSVENVLQLTLSLSWRDLPFFLIFEGLVLSPFLSFFFFKNSSVFKKMNLFRNVFCVSLSYKFFFRPFFVTFLFLFITCRIHLFFHSLFRLTFYFLDLLLLELIFCEQQFPFCIKKLFNFSLFYKRALPLYVLLLFIDLFICCLFFLFLLSLSMRNTYLTLLHFHKLFNFLLDIFSNLYVFPCSSILSVFFSLFLCVLSSFLGHSPFLISFLNICFSHVSFFVLFECISPFFEDSLSFDYTFPAFFLLLHTLLSFQQPRFFTKSCLLSPFFWKKSFLLLPVFSLHEKKLCHWKFVDSFWNFRFWTLHIHLHQFNIFPFKMSTLPLYSLLLFILYPLVLSLSCLAVYSRFFHFSLFLFFFFSWSWIVSLTFFFCFLLFTKTTILFFFSTKNTILFGSFLVGHVSQLCFLLCIVFLCLAKWFLVFVLTLLDCFLFLPLNIQFLIYYFPVLMKLKNVVFFPQTGEDIFCFFLFLQFFFSSFSVLSFVV